MQYFLTNVMHGRVDICYTNDRFAKARKYWNTNIFLQVPGCTLFIIIIKLKTALLQIIGHVSERQNSKYHAVPKRYISENYVLE